MSNLSNSPPRQPRILLQVSASISAFKAVALCSKLVQAQFEIEVILSPDVHWFVGPASFEGLTSRKVHQGNFDEGAMMAHIKLERWADLILLYPASANTLAQLAQGLSQSLIGSVFLAHEFKKPYWIVPAMNQAMIAHPATQANLERLKSYGIQVLEAESGALACGEIGAGRLIEPETMLAKIETYFKKNPEWKKNNALLIPVSSKTILITAGGTTEPIDQVRMLSNFSTGQTGYALAQVLRQRGHEVTLLQSKYSNFKDGFAGTLTYGTTAEFSKLMETELKNHSFDVVIHAAAVADYAVESIQTETGESLTTTSKIQGDSTLILKLKPNPKILKSVRRLSRNKNLKLISFKLTAGEDCDLKLNSYDSDLIVHNRLENVHSSKHAGSLYSRQNSGVYSVTQTFSSKTELAQLISQWIETEAPPRAEHKELES